MALIMKWFCVKQMTRAISMVHQPNRHGKQRKVKTYAKLVCLYQSLRLSNWNAIYVLPFAKVNFVYFSGSRTNNNLPH